MPGDRFELDRPPEQRSVVAQLRLRYHQEKVERAEYNRTHPRTPKAEPTTALTPIRLQRMIESARLESEEPPRHRRRGKNRSRKRH